MVLAHAFNPKHLGGRGRQISEFEASLTYRVSSRIARATQRNPVSNKQTNKKTKTKEIKPKPNQTKPITITKIKTPSQQRNAASIVILADTNLVTLQRWGVVG